MTQVQTVLGPNLLENHRTLGDRVEKIRRPDELFLASDRDWGSAYWWARYFARVYNHRVRVRREPVSGLWIAFQVNA